MNIKKKTTAIHICKYDKLMDVMREDIHEIKADVKSLLVLKWQLAGASAIMSVIISVLIAYFGR